MILYGGKIYEDKEQNRLLEQLENYINETLEKRSLSADTVIDAVDKLGREISEGKYDKALAMLDSDKVEEYKALAAKQLSREGLEFKLKTELGGLQREYVTSPPEGFEPIKIRVMPLGVIFHIAAGNMEGLPAYSLAEGLITGNINILKLPRADNGLSVSILLRLIELEPKLKDYIFVFDTPSTDIPGMKRMAELADGICVWGGDEAIKAVRQLAPTGAKLIEWGHKLGFCYVSGYENEEKELEELGRHIASTGQLLCSSCQCIFIDTESEEELHGFCRRFLPYLENAMKEHRGGSVGSRAYRTLLRQTEYIESLVKDKEKNDNEYRGDFCRLVVQMDSELRLAPSVGTVLVKPLPRCKITATLRRKKGCLQTAGLICTPERRQELTELLFRSGITRVTCSGNMSAVFGGEAHDGEYALRRYVRIGDIEI